MKGREKERTWKEKMADLNTYRNGGIMVDTEENADSNEA